VRKASSGTALSQFIKVTASRTLIDRFETKLLPNLRVLSFDTQAAYKYGQVRDELERNGVPIGDADLRIAAIALARGFTMVTGNTNHFRRVPGLPVENWLELS
jgi:predicted nucleic acid-binding protein